MATNKRLLQLVIVVLSCAIVFPPQLAIAEQQSLFQQAMEAKESKRWKEARLLLLAVEEDDPDYDRTVEELSIVYKLEKEESEARKSQYDLLLVGGVTFVAAVLGTVFLMRWRAKPSAEAPAAQTPASQPDIAAGTRESPRVNKVVEQAPDSPSSASSPQPSPRPQTPPVVAQPPASQAEIASDSPKSPRLNSVVEQARTSPSPASSPQSSPRPQTPPATQVPASQAEVLPESPKSPRVNKVVEQAPTSTSSASAPQPAPQPQAPSVVAQAPAVQAEVAPEPPKSSRLNKAVERAPASRSAAAAPPPKQQLQARRSGEAPAPDPVRDFGNTVRGWEQKRKDWVMVRDAAQKHSLSLGRIDPSGPITTIKVISEPATDVAKQMAELARNAKRVNGGDGK